MSHRSQRPTLARISSSRVLLALGALLAAAVLSGCQLMLTQGNPRPNIALNPQSRTLRLVLATSIPTDFTLPRQNGIMEAEVQGWRTTVQNGFRNGFADTYRLAPAKGPADLTLTLESVGLELVPTAVSSRAGVVAIDAHVRYKATLTDASGRSRRTAGTATSKKSAVSRDEVTQLADSALESMYELIAKDLFAAGGA